MKNSPLYYNKHAKKDCRECEGLGIIRFAFGQSDTQDAACPYCFPEEAERYHRINADFLASQIFEEASYW